MDIDVGQAKADQGKGYADIKSATSALDDFCEQSGLPKPNWIIGSGGGLHAYWVVATFIPKEIWNPYAQKLKALAAKLGLLADPSRTADIASLLRVPGTLNHKYNPPRPVQVLESSATFIDNATLLGAIDSAWKKHCRPVAAIPTPQLSIAQDNLVDSDARSNEPADIPLLEAALKVLDPDCDDPTWKLHRIAPLARAGVNHPDQAADLKHLAKRWSSGELGGKPSKAWVTPGQNNGKTGEQIFESVWARFGDPVRIPLIADTNSIVIADSVPRDGGHAEELP